MYSAGIENRTSPNLFLRLSAKKAACYDLYPTVAAGGWICAAGSLTRGGVDIYVLHENEGGDDINNW